MTTEKCEYCRYYNEGECRRFPPQIWETTETGGSNFPRIDKNGWCGEYSPKFQVKVENGVIYAACPPVQGTIVSVQEF